MDGEIKSEIDWMKEKSNLIKPTDWWKPTPGQHKILFVSNGENYDVQFEDKNLEKVRFEIEVKGKRMTWGVVKGKTRQSLYGQIVLIASKVNNLTGQTINLIVKGIGKETSYTVMEALSLMDSKEE